MRAVTSPSRQAQPAMTKYVAGSDQCVIDVEKTATP